MIYYLHVVLVTSRSRIELVVWGNETVSMLAKSFVTRILALLLLVTPISNKESEKGYLLIRMIEVIV